MAAAVGEIDSVAMVAALELTRSIEADGLRAASLERLAWALPPSTVARRRKLLLADSSGTVIASFPAEIGRESTLANLLADAAPLAIFAERAGVMTVNLPDGSEMLATVRAVPGGQIVVMQPVSEILAGFQAQLTSQVIVGGLFLAVCASLGSVCVRQLSLSRSVRHDRDRVTRRLDTSLSRGRCGLWDWDIPRGRIFWSDSMYDLLGYGRRAEPLSFGEVTALIHPGDIDLYRVAEDVASASLTQVDCEFRIKNAAGAWIWLRVRAEAMRDGADNGRHLVGIVVDVTDERGRVEENAAADMRLRDAIEAISEAFVLWDADNKLVLCNSKFRKLHDLPSDITLPGTSYNEVMTAGRPPVVEHQKSHRSACLSGARTVEAQLSDGRWLHINERRTRDGGFVSVGTDITDLKRHEAQLVDSKSRLLKTVADLRQSRETLETRTQQLAELAERNLDQKSEAESANRSKTEFLAKMSHELRTPLNAIINFAEIMQDGMFGPIDDRYAGYSRDIHQSGLYLLSIINDILDMSTLEAGRRTLTTAPLPLADAVTRAMAAISEQAHAKKIALAMNVKDDPNAIADSCALQQILGNVLQNAVKFTPVGGTVGVRVRRALSGVNIFIEDSGVGIPPSALAKIGRPFEQVESEFSRSYKGAGLGLAIARSLTELQGGRLNVRSQPGLGTIVLVHLPAADPAFETVACPMRTQFAA